MYKGIVKSGYTRAIKPKYKLNFSVFEGFFEKLFGDSFWVCTAHPFYGSS